MRNCCMLCQFTEVRREEDKGGQVVSNRFNSQVAFPHDIVLIEREGWKNQKPLMSANS